MQADSVIVPDASRLLLSGARIPAELVEGPPGTARQDAEGALALDLLLDGGRTAGV
ncbi:MAG: hypothetical protein IOD00_13195, partial [Rhodobacter sp.]|nr:hypothetical protein [Rhodobacter sp.]